MHIGVVADTHSLEVPKEVLKVFKTMDMIIHAGDFCSVDDLNVFAKINTLKAVYGNMDDMQLRKKLPEVDIFTVENVTIGIFHGEGPAVRVIDFVEEKFKGKDLDVIIFGHSHYTCNELRNGTLYFNPGSPNDTIVAPYCSYGILEINGSKVKGKIIKL